MNKSWISINNIAMNSARSATIYNLIPYILWTSLCVNLLLLFLIPSESYFWLEGEFLRINRFTILLWGTVSFFGSIVSTYALNYFKSNVQRNRFLYLCLSFTLSVMFFAASENLILLIFGWYLMGKIMSNIIGLDKNWEDAKSAKRITTYYFLGSATFLALGVLLPCFHIKAYNLTDLIQSVGLLPNYLLLISSGCIMASALIQSAIVPFHKWLLSAMTAPTPGSALMHAGFVNGSGIVLTLFAPLLIKSNTLIILFIVGGLTAILAQFTKLIQVNLKHRLACSTIAQMGFMVMQCGLGFFNAAIAHLILHGFYKANLFLSSSEEIEKSNPKAPPKIIIKWPQALLVLIFSLIGAYAFVNWTGKGMNADSGIFLTLIVLITVGQITYNIVKQHIFTVFQKIILPPLLFLSGIGLYSLLYIGISKIMMGSGLLESSGPLSSVHIIFGVFFLLGFFLMKLGIYRNSNWLYTKLMNASQPHKKTILMHTNLKQ